MNSETITVAEICNQINALMDLLSSHFGNLTISQLFDMIENNPITSNDVLQVISRDENIRDRTFKCFTWTDYFYLILAITIAMMLNKIICYIFDTICNIIFRKILSIITPKRHLYKVVHSDGAVVRDGLDIDSSNIVCNVSFSQIIDSSGEIKIVDGICRLRVSNGWISMNLRNDGTPIVEKI